MYRGRCSAAVHVVVVHVVLRWKDESDRLLPTAVHLEGPCM